MASSLNLSNQSLQILDTIREAFFSLDEHWNFVYLNKQAEKLLDRKRSQLIGKNIWTEYPEAKKDVFYKKYQEAIKTQQNIAFETYYKPLKSWFSINACPIENGLTVYFSNITDRKHIEKSLKDSENKYQNLFENLQQGIVYRDANTLEITFANKAAELILGTSASAMVGKKLGGKYWKSIKENGEVYPEAEYPHRLAINQKKIIRDIVIGVYNYQKNSYVWVKVTAVPVYNNSDTEPYQVYSIFEDITEQKNIKRELQLSEQYFKTMADTMPQLIWITQPNGYHEYYNKRWYEYTESNYAQTKGDGWNHMFHPDDQPRAWKAWQHSLKTGQPYEIEYRLRNGKTGEYRWFLGRALPVRDDTGQIIKWFGTCTDIDEQKRTLETQTFLSEASTILASSLDYKTTLQTVAEIAVPSIADWCSISMKKNDETVEQVALAHKDPKKIKWGWELNKKYPTDLSRPTGLGEVLRTGKAEFYPFIDEKLIAKTVKNKKELDIIKKVGFTSVMIVPICSGTTAIGAITFVSAESEKRFTETDLNMAKALASRASLAIDNSKLYRQAKNNETKFTKLSQANILGVFTASYSNTLNQINSVFAKICGYSEEEIRSRTITLKEIIPFDPCYETLIAELRTKSHITPVETELIHKDGHKVPILIGLVDLENNDTFLGFILDITERKELERRKDEFIGIASHELKTPLTSIKGYTQILETIIEEMGNDKAKQLLTKASIYIDRLNSLISDLLDISKIQAGKLQFNYSKFDFDTMVKESIESVQPITVTHTITLSGKTGASVYGDKHRLEQVVANLLTNAIKYSPQANAVTVSLSLVKEGVKVSVKDFGIGIHKDQLDKLFERFFRVEKTALQFSGLGIGLYISSEIVKRHRGTISVKSTENKGSTFSFTIPLTTNNADSTNMPL